MFCIVNIEYMYYVYVVSSIEVGLDVSTLFDSYFSFVAGWVWLIEIEAEEPLNQNLMLSKFGRCLNCICTIFQKKRSIGV